MVRRTTPAPPTLWDDPDEPTWSVPEIGEAIGLSLRAAFPDEVWVRGVIRNLNPGRRGGTVWFDLVEPAPGGDLSRPPQASLPVVLFDMARRRVNARLTDAGGGVRMTDGTEVRIRGRLTYWDRGGRLQLQMSDVDPAFTLGRLAADRDRLLRALDAEGLLDRQAALPRPAVPLHLGLVTSARSAAEHDVLDELRRSGIGFRVVRADVRVQGVRAPRSVAWGLAAVAARGVDLVLLVRGGGATTDLAAFDSETIARAVATLDVPVLVGVGHDVDRSVADEVAHASYKTPTACAQAVVADVRAVERRTLDAWRGVAGAAQRHGRREAERLRACGRHVALATRQGLAAADRDLTGRGVRVDRAAAGALARATTVVDRAVGRIEAGGRAHLRTHDQALAGAAGRLALRAPRATDAAGRELDRIEAQVRALDPARTLARGWSITRTADGRIARSARGLAPGDALVTTLADGTVRSTVDPPADPPADPSADTPADPPADTPADPPRSAS
ncbi:MAG TPA: exodeoxyribonuclease VII large subunit [Acidimicrobiales bacterium]|nr:exodeoxyribonuclease VII large subunit [Acidimicrobiales bacterium]